MDGLVLVHSDVCKALIEDYKPRLQYWLDKAPKN